MKMFSPLFQILLGIAVFIPSIIDAQNEVNKPQPSQGFRMTLFNDWEGPDIYVRDKKDYEPIKVHKMAYTRVIPFPEEGLIALYAKVTGENGQETFQPFLRVGVSGSIDEPLLLLYWDGAKKRPGGKIIEYSPKKFGYGSYQIVNISSVPIVGYIGSKKNRYLCKAGESYISKFKLEKGEKTPITAYVRGEDDGYSLVYSTLSIHRERKRVVLFLHPERNGTGRLVYRSQSLVDFANGAVSP